MPQRLIMLHNLCIESHDLLTLHLAGLSIFAKVALTLVSDNKNYQNNNRIDALIQMIQLTYCPVVLHQNDQQMCLTY